MTFHDDPLAFLLGPEGAALLHARAGDHPDPAFSNARIAEITTMPAADRSEFGEAGTLSEIDLRTGCRDRSRTYDDEDNPLIAVEQPEAWSILDGLPPGPALDAACGTGRHTARRAGR